MGLNNVCVIRIFPATEVMVSKSIMNKVNQVDKNNGIYPRYTEQALVVDDDEIICDVIATALAGLGLQVDTVGSAQKALDYYHSHHVDLVISDWKMPGMNGIELLNRLRRQDPYLAAILVTGFGTKETVIEAFTKGKINYYLSKPFKLAELRQVVSAAIKERRLGLSERDFRLRLEKEIQAATEELARKNDLLQQKQEETEKLYQELQVRQVEVEGTKKYLENLIESSVDAIISIDNGHRITLFSRAAERMFGQKFRALAGTPISHLFAGGDSELVPLLKKLVKKRRVKHYETRMQGRSGEELMVDVAASVLDPVEGAKGYLFIIKDIAERKRLEEELLDSNKILEKLSITDGLTGLFNHRYFQKCLQEEFQRARRYKTRMAMIMLDLDDFKQVNDNYGHQVGNQALIQLADLIRDSIREVDTPARYGGEEFAVVLPQTNIEDALVVAGRIKEAIEKSIRFQKIQPGLSLTASLGLASYPDSEAKNVVDLIRYADDALFRAKQIGKNRIVIGASSGLTPLGRGERLTQSEKKQVISRISNMLRNTLDLEAILEFMLDEISKAIKQTDEEVACSIMLADKNRGLEVVVEKTGMIDRRRDFDIIAHITLEKRRFQVIGEDDEHGPVASYPITIERPDQGEEIVGIINIGAVPTDIDFFKDMANQAALGILNAKLYHEMTLSKTALETKVNQLMTLSLMGMALQRNALLYDDYTSENSKLLARCLAQTGFEKVLVYQFNCKSRMLHSGVDNTFRGDETPERVSLEDLDRNSQLGKAIFKQNKKHAPANFFDLKGELSPGERSVFQALNLSDQRVGVARLIETEKTRGLVFAAKQTLNDEDGDSLALFVLHASLILENLHLSTLSQEKCRRLAMIHDIGLNLSAAATDESRNLAAVEALNQLTAVLEASEISVYYYTQDKKNLELLAYSSTTAKPGNAPLNRIRLKDSELMSRVVEQAQSTSRTEPLIINNLPHVMKVRRQKRYATDSYMGVPLVCGGRLLGIMNVTDKMDQSDFTTADVELAQTTAGMLAAVLLRFNLLKILEEQKDAAVMSLVKVSEAARGKLFGGRGRRISDVSTILAKLLNLAPDEVEAVGRLAWETQLWQGLEGLKEQPPRSSIEDILNWSRKIGSMGESLVPLSKDAVPSHSRPRRLEARQQKIIRIATRLEDLYFSFKPKQRPGLSRVLIEILSTDGRAGGLDVIEALFRGLLNEKIKHGARRVKMSAAEARELYDSLKKASFVPDEYNIRKDVARKFMTVLREEREDF